MNDKDVALFVCMKKNVQQHVTKRPLSPAPHALPYTTGFQSLHLSQAVNHSARLMFSSCTFLIFIATENVHKMLLTSSLEESP